MQTTEWGQALLSQIFGGANGFALLLLALSAVALTLFFERLWVLYTVEIDAEALFDDIRPAVQRGNPVEAIELCEQARGALGHILSSGLHCYDRDPGAAERAMQLTTHFEITRLEKNTRLLGAIASIAPVIGVIGALSSLFQTFVQMRTAPVVDLNPSGVMAALEGAILNATLGVVVALPLLLCYQYLRYRIEQIATTAEYASAQLADLLHSQR